MAQTTDRIAGPLDVFCPHCKAKAGAPCLYRGKPKEGYFHVAREGAVEKERYKVALRNLLPIGEVVYGIVKHVSASGMSRRIDFYCHEKDGLRYLSGYVAEVLGYPRHDSGAVVVTGCGMDMIFHVVHSLSYAIHGHKSKGKQGRFGAVGRNETSKSRYTAGYTLHSESL